MNEEKKKQRNKEGQQIDAKELKRERDTRKMRRRKKRLRGAKQLEQQQKSTHIYQLGE